MECPIICFLDKIGDTRTLCFVGIIVCMILVYLIFTRHDKKRAEEIKKSADLLNFTFASQQQELLNALSDFKLFGIGYSRKALNVLHGENENIEWTVFDYQYSLSSGRRSVTYTQTVAYTEIAGLSIPKFFIEAESFLHRLGDMIDQGDVNFEEFPVFSKKYILKADDEAAIRKFFTPEIIKFFESRNSAVTVEASGNKIIIYYLKVEVLSKELPSFIGDAAKIVKILAVNH
ncbi:MAG: hypothetical protein ABII88_06015 [Candidatus Omnitrophota bacterium]